MGADRQSTLTRRMAGKWQIPLLLLALVLFCATLIWLRPQPPAPPVERVVGQVKDLERRGVKSGVNLLVARSQLAAAAKAAAAARGAGVGNDRIVYLPMRVRDTPTPREVADVAGGGPFQSMSCLTGCAKSPRFVSVDWDRRVAWCSYTQARAPLRQLSHAGLMAALELVSDRAKKSAASKDAVAKVYETAYDAGVMVRTSGNNVIISPPLVITAADVQRIISALDAGLSAAEGK